MKFYKSDLLYKAIFYEDTLIGFVRDIIIDPNNGKILGYAIKPDCSRYIAYEDCLFLINRFFCKERDPVIDTEDVIYVNEIIKEKRGLINKPVVTRSGKKIGTLTDFQVDTSYGVLEQIVVHQYKFLWFNLGYKRLIDHRKIYSISEDEVTIMNEKEKVKTKVKSIKKKFGLGIKQKEAEPVYGSASLDS
jgi:sporulation protein YlmC with PRC-barrel domain